MRAQIFTVWPFKGKAGQPLRETKRDSRVSKSQGLLESQDRAQGRPESCRRESEASAQSVNRPGRGRKMRRTPEPMGTSRDSEQRPNKSWRDQYARPNVFTVCFPPPGTQSRGQTNPQGEQYACPNVFTVCFLQAASHAKKGSPRYLYLHAPKR